ncbi:hypothetical protein BDQ17DRAFT_798226 [Cyathus striatus]|nr:hypothetical protein BDQ17DRAFT_798226 [Cyathus striatus]
MLIKLLPAHPHSTVLFSFTFGDIEPQLCNPPSWCSQLVQLQRDDLELPKYVHALDRSVGLVALLTQVTFDLPARTVTCQFVDGSQDVWVVGSVAEGDLVLEKWIRKLEGVLDDVYEATWRTKRNEREKRREKVRQIESNGRNHKRQRSLFMSVVSSLGSMITLNRTSGLPTPPSTPLAPQSSSLPLSSKNVCPRFLRRRARSSLVDTFRLYVLSELARRSGFVSRLPHSSSYSISTGSGAYYAWIVQSMFRRATSRMDELVQLAAERGARGGAPISPVSHYSYNGCQEVKENDMEKKEKEEFCPTTMNVPSLFSDDEGDDTDTSSDWSSVHTPTSCSMPLSRLPSTASTISSVHSSSTESAHLTSLLSSLTPYLSPRLLAEFEVLSHARRRLYHLLVACHSTASHAALEERARLDILEIRSRRRAWSNKALSGTGVRELGLAVPVRSSPLSRYSWGPDSWNNEIKGIKVRWEESIVNEDEEYDLDIKSEIIGPRKRRKSIGAPKLFPVTEVEEEEGVSKSFAIEGSGDDYDEEDNLLRIEMGLDLEGGVRRIGADDEEAGLPIAFEVEKPIHRPRIRTASMHERRRLHNRQQHAQRVTVSFPPSSVPLPALSQPSHLPISALLCQPVSFGGSPSPPPPPSPITPEDDKPPVYTELAFGVAQYTKEADEFTLSMDVPVRKGVLKQSRGRKRRIPQLDVDIEAGYNVC